MKTIEQIIKSRPVFLHDWKESRTFGVFMDFEDIYITLDEYKAKEPPYSNVEFWNEKKEEAQKALLKHAQDRILFATYTYADYSGSAFVLFEKEGKLYEVNGNHCSCYGLEGQWDPEEVSLKELENRILNGSLGDDWNGGRFDTELKKFLGIKQVKKGGTDEL